MPNPMQGGDALAVEDQRSLMSVKSIAPQPETINKIVKRLRLMIIKLLPVEVEVDSISDPTSSIITPAVISAFAAAGGDFLEAVPFCLLRARALFIRDSKRSPADFDENVCRATAAETLARRIVHIVPADRLCSVMSTRYRYREADGDLSAPTSALETAIDQSAIIFLSSSESEEIVNALWKGELVATYGEEYDVDFVEAEVGKRGSTGFWDHLNVHRLQVPRYANLFSIATWLIFLFIYSQSVQAPLEGQDRRRMSGFEIALYGLNLSFFIDGCNRLFKRLRLSANPWAAFGFWTIVDLIVHSLLITALSLRIAGIKTPDGKQSAGLQLKAFQFLSLTAPLIWLKLITIFDTFKFIGTMQIVVFQMIRDSAVFFVLLALIAIGFLQSMYALDAADGQVAEVGYISNSLLQALLGSPDFDGPSERFGYPFGLIIYYGWNFCSPLLLLNLLIAVFNDSYSQTVENATDYHMAFFAGKCMANVRLPDQNFYPPPFNLIEIAIAPLELVLPKRIYARLNQIIMSILFGVPLTIIALYESQRNAGRANMSLILGNNEIDTGEDDDEGTKNPDCRDDDQGDICSKSFDELTSVFPDAGLSTSAVIQREIQSLREELKQLRKELSSGTKREGNGQDEK